MKKKSQEKGTNFGLGGVDEDAGIWLESDGEYTLFSIHREGDDFYLYIAGEGWKKRGSPVKVASLQEGRRIAEAIVRFLKKGDTKHL